MLTDLHIHTLFCDGKSTPEEMVRSALAKGFTAIGFSGHAPAAFAQNYCLRDMPGYIAEVKRLQEAYRGRIRIYLGAEEEAGAPIDRAGFDYIIGSCHHAEKDGRLYPLDWKRELLQQAIDAFGGDPCALAENYYSRFSKYILERKPEVVGHFDLLTKFDEMDTPLFSHDPRYHTLAEKYLRMAMESGCVFEVNTGAISRGYRKSPYPAVNLLQCLQKHGGKVTVNSDSHNVSAIGAAFTEAKALLREVGFTHIYQLTDAGFVPTAI